jgi:hypothetical protein
MEWSMMFLLYEVHPKPSHSDYGSLDGAFASMWVNEHAQAPAEVVAREFLEASLWDVEVLEEAYPVTLDTYVEGDLGRERFQQALVDGVVVTFHRWPVGAPDE